MEIVIQLISRIFSLQSNKIKPMDVKYVIMVSSWQVDG